MASQFFLSLLLFVSLAYAQPSSISPDIQQACKATRYPTSCTTYLKSYPHNNTLDIIQSAIDVAYDNLNRTMDVVWSIMNTTGNANSTRAAGDCHDFLLDSADCILSASVILQTRNTTLYILPRLDQKDARAYMSSALKYQYDCGSALKYANDTKLLNETMSYLNVATVLTGDALSMLFASDVYGNEPASWTPPRTERDGLWEAGWQLVKSGAALSTGISDVRVNVTVCKDGVGRCLKTIKEALDMAPQDDDHRKFRIHIKEGVYEETVRVTKPNVIFWGDGIGKTVITGSLNGGQLGLPTYHTATVGVEGDRFMATGLTIQNTAGPDAEQAVAFRSTSDLSIIENCEFLGNHGTLYAHGPNQFYKSCRIEGNVDFIFGNGAAVFQDCQILVRPGQLKPEDGETNVITAQGRLDPAQMTGFVFLNCLINGTEEYMRLYNSKPQVHNTFLGRPSNEYSRTVFIKCTLEALVSPQGWTPWDGDFALKTLFYGEYGNTGPGSNMSQRVPWSSMISPEQIGRYYVKNFLRGKRKFKHIPSRISLGETVRI